jgi:hypothetical protein
MIVDARKESNVVESGLLIHDFKNDSISSD